MLRTESPLELGHLVQVDIVRDDLGVELLAELDELGVHVADLGEIQLRDNDRDL